MDCRVLLGLLLAIATPARAEWRVAESAHFRIFGDLPATALRERAVLLEDYRDTLGMFTNAKPVEGQPKLDIYIVDNIADAVPFGRIDKMVGGFYSASQSGIIAFATGGASGQATLLHEYAHHHMRSTSAIAYPAWYVEGFAEYFATARFQPERIELGLFDQGRAYSLANASWLPWDKVVDPAFRYKGHEQAALFYAQSWLLTHYLFRTPGMAARQAAYLKAVAAGEAPLAAFTTHVEPSFDVLSRQLRRYGLDGRGMTYSQLRRTARPAAAVTVRVLPPSARKLALLVAAMEHVGGGVANRAAALSQVRAAAAAFPDDPLAERALAQAELNFGDPGAADARLDRLLAVAPEDATLLRWKAESLLRHPDGGTPERRSTVRRLLVRAFKADPADWRTMHNYLHTFDLEHAPLAESQFQVLLRAYELAPQVDGLAIDVAAALVQRGDFAGAARALAPMAFAPHDGPLTRWARVLRARADAKDKPGFVTALDKGPPPEEPQAGTS